MCDTHGVIASLPRVTFGMIVLNGDPYLRYNLRAIYPFAHEIIVVEGAAPAAANIATPSGHSTDTTLEVLQDFKTNEDPEDKLTVVFAEDNGHPDGFWPGEKDEQSQAYASRATGDYLWQIDCDEFYRPEDVVTVLQMLRDDPEITAVSFKQITFWGGFDYVTDGWLLRSGAEIYHRLFKWSRGHQYVAHRPPTVQDAQGRDMRDIKWINGYALADRGIFLYHYSLVFPKQVIEKSEYYGVAQWNQWQDSKRWVRESFLTLRSPYRVHNVYQYPSWLDRYIGDHPPQIEALRQDIKSGRVHIELRPTEDIESLLRSPRYRSGRAILKFAGPLAWRFGKFLRRRVHPIFRFLTDPAGSAIVLKSRISKSLGRRT